MGQLTKINLAMNEALIETMEQMAFTELIIKKSPPSHTEFYAFYLDILLPYRGSVKLIIDKELAKLVIKNLVLDENLQNGKDVVGELLNIIVGYFFQKTEPTQLFELGIPVECDTKDMSDYTVTYFENEAGHSVTLGHQFARYL